MVWLLALVVAAVGGAGGLAGLLAAYAVAWVVVNAMAVRGVELPPLERRRRAAIAAAIAAAPIAMLWGRRDAIAETEALVGLGTHLEDRLRLEGEPALHPGLVRSDRPQLFFVRASGAEQVRVTLAPGIAPIDAEALGHGVFRVDYDPRAHGAASARGEARAIVEVDGARTELAVEAISPLAHPRWLRASPDRRHACTTSEETDELFVIDREGLAAHVATADGPSDCAFLDAEHVAVAHRYAPVLQVVAIDGAPIATLEVPRAAHRLASDAAGTLAIAHEDGQVVMIDTHDPGVPRIVARGDAGGLADWIAIDPGPLPTAASALIVARRAPAALLRMRAQDGTERGGARLAVELERALLAPATTLAPASGAGALLIATTDWSDARAPEPHLGNHFVQDQLVLLDARTLAPLRRVLTAHRSPRQDAAGGLDRGVSPLGADVSPDGTWLVAFAGSDEIARLAPGDAALASIDVATRGISAPVSAVLLDRDRVAISSPSSGRIAILDRDGGARATVALAPDDATLLRDDPDALRRRYGERAFYEGTRAGVSCQSCHLHGASDGLLHNIGGRVLVPTLDVRGARGTSPYLRDGSYPRLSDLHEVADELYRGYREPAGDRGATIEAWIAAEPPPLPLAPRDPDAERRGLDVFVRSGCPTCHAPPAMTNLGRHPLGAVFPDAAARTGDENGARPLDTPSLRATARRTRWLFDGRAASLAAIFERESRGGRHGRTRALGERETRDLVRFLESL